MTALMPCPFCGGNARQYEECIACFECAAEGPFVFAPSETSDGKYAEMLAEAWNTRHTTKPLAPALDIGVRSMTPADIRAIVAALPITAAQLDAVMGVSPGSVSRWQTGTVTPTAPVLRLLRAYADGYRPSDWPHKGET